MSWKQAMTRTVRGLTFVYCPYKHPHIQAYLDDNHLHYKELNPWLPFDLRPKKNIETAQMTAYFWGGRTEKIDITESSDEQIEEKIKQMVVIGEKENSIHSDPEWNSDPLGHPEMPDAIEWLPEETPDYAAENNDDYVPTENNLEDGADAEEFLKSSPEQEAEDSLFDTSDKRV
ncbi:hypothetical protein AKO1_007319 [Acrasis kona]|uniref:Ribosomal protein/NADH dehydrogenase domain-containing protein n=1 Tax=Acrasis kona TaxID=1008807 RepID=A0AAW2YS18_9EUKA